MKTKITNYNKWGVKSHPNKNSLIKSMFTNYIGIRYIMGVVAKSTTEPRNSTQHLTANTSTPQNKRAFFVCSLRTPKEKVKPLVLSMVTCSGKGSALCYIPLGIVFETVTRYRQLLASKLNAVTFNVNLFSNGANNETYQF